MNEQATATEVTVCDGCRLIPVSHLALDLDVPVRGWEMLLSEQGIDVQTDDCGRPAIARSVFGAMVRDQASMQKLQAERAGLLAAGAAQIERRTPVPASVPAVEGLSAYESMVAASDYMSLADEFGPPKPNWVAHELDESARRRADEEAKAGLVAQMRDDLSGKGKQ
jgi:hypothetical protein